MIDMDTREAVLESALHRAIGRSRGATSMIERQRATRALETAQAAIAQAGFNGLGIRTILADLQQRGRKPSTWWQAYEARNARRRQLYKEVK